MNPTRRGILAALAIAAALVLGTAAPALAEEIPDASPAGPPPADSFISPAHSWVDPSDLTFSVDFHFPIPTTHWVMHGSAPLLVESGSGVTHCQLRKQDFGGSLACNAIGTAAPGDKDVRVTVRSEADGDVPGVNWEFTTVVTVCPLTGCSPLFELDLADPALQTCAGADLAELPANAYEFNVPWNAELVEIGEFSSDPGGDWEFVTGPPLDGSPFEFRGSFANPGDYTLPITLTDEFGGPHTADLEVTVDDCSAPAPAPVLAATGRSGDYFDGMIAWATGFAVLGLIAVVLAACAARRRDTRDSLGG